MGTVNNNNNNTIRFNTTDCRFDFTNICGLRANLQSVFAHLQLEHPEIFALCETQVFTNRDIAQYDCPGYIFYPTFFPHRGVGVYVKDNLICSRQSQLEKDSTNVFTFIWLKLKIDRKDIYCCFLYRSGACSSEETWTAFNKLSATIDDILEVSPNAEIVLAGDFNVHNDRWLPYSNSTNLPGIYAEMFALVNGLTQLTNAITYFTRHPNQTNSLLDLFLTSDPHKYNIITGPPLGGSDHAVVSAVFAHRNTPPVSGPISTNRLIWDFQRANWEGLNNYFREFDWSICFFSDVNDAATILGNSILGGMRRYIPNKSSYQKQQKVPWFNKRCKRAILAKNSAFLSFKRVSNEINKDIYISARNSCNSVVDHEKHRFDLKIQNRISSSNKGGREFWSIVKSVNSNFTRSNIPPLINNNGVPLVESKDKSNLLASIFANNSNIDDTGCVPPIIPFVETRMGNIRFRNRNILPILTILNIHKSAGPDGIPPIVLNRCARTLVGPLRRLFQMSFSSGVFPEIWKSANITPISKKGGSRSDPTNYRPISVTSILSKVMEKVINRKLIRYLEDNRLLNDNQYGFREKRATGELITLLTDKFNKAVHAFGESLSISLDISKAFERVWHKGLLYKLATFGINDQFINWTESYLSNRKIRVIVDNTLSDIFNLNSGVPQGCILSATFFIIYINDLLRLTENHIFAYADDSTLIAQYSLPRGSGNDVVQMKRSLLVNSVNRDLELISQWGVSNLVKFNGNKTKACIVSNKRNIDYPPINFDNTVIIPSDNIDSLGMNIADNLVWHDHITGVSKKAACRLGFLRRSKQYFTPSCLALIYKSFIRPLLEYNSYIWAGASVRSRRFIDRIQDRAIRMIHNNAVTDSIDSLEHRRSVSALCRFYKYFHGDCSLGISDIMPQRATFSHNTRSSQRSHPFTVALNFNHTNKARNSFIPRTSRMWNSLPLSVFPTSPDIKDFKTKIHEYLRNNPFPILPGQSYPEI